MDRLGAMAQFVRVVEAGSFSAAARILGQGQPAISKAVAQLEQRLGVRLLTRTTRAVTMTDAGRVFYERARTALDAAEEADAAARGSGATLTGRLRICAPVTFSRLHIVPNLPTFTAAHPGLELDLILDDRRIDLVEEGIDVAVRAGGLADSSLVATKLATAERQVIASADFWKEHPPVRTPADLAGLPFVAYGPSPGGLDWVFANEEGTQLVRMQQRIRMSAVEGVREAVFAGLGFAIASQWVFADATGTEKAQRILPECRLPSVDLWTIFPAGRQPSARARVFADFLRKIVGRLEI